MGDKTYTVFFSQDKTWYAVPELSRCNPAIWLGVEKVPAPIPDNLKRRDTLHGAAVMPERSYWRRFSAVQMAPGPQETRLADDELVADYRDASWWTPGIAEPRAAESEVGMDAADAAASGAAKKFRKAVK